MVWGSCDANMGQLVTGTTLLVRERNHTSEYRRERVRRQTIAEGAFASLDRMGWARSRLRGLWKVDCEGYMASFAHNVLKAVRKLGRWTGPAGPASPNGDIPDVVANDLVGITLSYLYQRGRFALVSLFIVVLRPAFSSIRLLYVDF